jgi:alpha-glucosidase (family GH31 glycosyl hydrolase)
MSVHALMVALRVLPVTVLVLLVLVEPPGVTLSSLAFRAPERPRPPLTPRWAYEPWVWEDEENDADATIALVDGYLQRDIPVGVVIVDSPWQTNYNTFEMAQQFGNPERLLSRLRDRDVRVIFWATGFINTSSTDGPDRGMSSNFQEAYDRGFLVNGGQTYEWDKGEGAALDFFNPDAVAWWYGEMDKAWAHGIDGWKVDSPEGNLPDLVQTAAGWKTNREYGDAYYRAFYEYVAQRDRDAIITARPYDSGTVYAPIDANPAGWVGDQEPDWGARGIEEALDNILASAELGFSMLGSDIGGYRPGERYDRLFVRWTQLGALSPLMENGGRGEHRPWRIDEEIVPTYRYYAKLHQQLVPYLYGLGVEAHLGGEPIIRDPDRELLQYRLGDDLFVAPIVTREDRRRVELPGDSRWFDYWDDHEPIPAGSSLQQEAGLERIPLFVRAGAIIPMEVVDDVTGHGGEASADALTLLLYPDGLTRRVLRPDAGRSLTVESKREWGGVTIRIGESREPLVLRIKEPVRPSAFAVEMGGSSEGLTETRSLAKLEQVAAGWTHDPERGYLWVRLPAFDGETVLRYETESLADDSRYPGATPAGQR